MTVVRTLATAILAAATLSSAAGAAVLRQADAVACVGMRETDETRGGNLPVMRAEPRPEAAAVGVIGGVVFVPQPRQDRAGYTLVVRPDWVEGWVQSAWLQPWRAVSMPGATCAVFLDGDGKLAWRVVPARKSAR